MISVTLSGVPLRARDLAENVFHHHYRAIHENAEIHRADGEQVGRSILQIEADEREQQRQRNGGGDNQSRAEIVEKKYEHHDDQQHAAQEVLLHHLRRQRDQIAAVVERDDFDILGQDSSLSSLVFAWTRFSTSWVFSPVRNMMTPSTASSWSS